MMNIENLNAYIDKQIEYWQPTGVLAVSENGKRVLTRTYGYSDKENTRKIADDEKFYFTFNEATFPKIALFLLIDEGKIKLNDKLDKYLPEYSHAKEIKIKHLLDCSAAIECWYNGSLMVDFDKDEAHKALPVEKRMAIEKAAFAKDRSYAEILQLINDSPLVDVPGNNPGEWNSYTYASFMQEIVQRLAGKTLFSFLKGNLFDKYGIEAWEGNQTVCDGYVMYRDVTPVYIPKTSAKNGVSINIDGLNTLAECFVQQKIFSEKLWATLNKIDKYGEGYLFNMMDGWKSLYAIGTEGFGLMIHFNIKRKTTLSFLCSRDYRYELVNNNWAHFLKCVRNEVQTQIIFPLEPKMVKYGLKTMAACSMTVRDDQRDFVSDAKSSLCWAFAEKDSTPYVLVDDDTAIGLLVLRINKKKNIFYVAVVLIDQRYQGRGYGRFLMNFAVDTLKNAGAKELSIGVNRHNVAARRLYESVGFTAAEVYDGGVFMKKKLD